MKQILNPDDSYMASGAGWTAVYVTTDEADSTAPPRLFARPLGDDSVVYAHWVAGDWTFAAEQVRDGHDPEASLLCLVPPQSDWRIWVMSSQLSRGARHVGDAIRSLDLAARSVEED